MFASWLWINSCLMLHTVVPSGRHGALLNDWTALACIRPDSLMHPITVADLLFRPCPYCVWDMQILLHQAFLFNDQEAPNTHYFVGIICKLSVDSRSSHSTAASDSSVSCQWFIIVFHQSQGWHFTSVVGESESDMLSVWAPSSPVEIVLFRTIWGLIIWCYWSEKW